MISHFNIASAAFSPAVTNLIRVIPPSTLIQTTVDCERSPRREEKSDQAGQNHC
jgi:hypothetical protein